MWILQILPFWFFHLITLLGIIGIIAGFVLGFVPIINRYKLPIQIISITVLTFGIYMEGAISNEEKWQQLVKEMEVKVEEAEIKANLANEEIETKTVEKTKIIREKGKIQIEYINRLVKGDTVEIVKDMSAEEKEAFLQKQKELQEALKNCPVPKIIVEEHNKAAEKK